MVQNCIGGNTMNGDIDLWVQRIIELVPIGLLTGLVGHYLSNKKDKRMDAQQLVDQIQEERNWTQQQLKERDNEIQGLKNEIMELRKLINDSLHENKELQWELNKVKEENNLLRKENEKLRESIEHLKKILKEKGTKEDANRIK